jgi:DNA-binding HxlR family transcriptional regulator
MQNGKEEFKDYHHRRVLDLNEEKTEKRFSVPEPVDWSEECKVIYTQEPWRINNILPEQGITILSSVSGEKKTWLALEMARALVSGTPFLSNPEFKTNGCNVVYIDAENSKSEFQRRCKQMKISINGPNKFYIHSDDDLNLNEPVNVQWLTTLLEYYNAKVVIIDTFRAVAGGLSDDKSVEVREFFNRFKSLKDKGISIVLLDHFRKPSNLDGKVPKKEHLIGSQDKTSSSEVLLMLKSESGTEKIEVYQRKNRLGKEIKPFEVLMVDTLEGSGTIKTTLTYNGDLDDDSTKKEDAKPIIQRLLTVSQKTTNELIAVLQKEVGSRNVRQALKELEESKTIESRRKGREKQYFLPSVNYSKTNNSETLDDVLRALTSDSEIVNE